MVREFYANWAPEARSHYVTVRGRNVPITPTCINDILGTPEDTDPLVLIGLNICPPYQAIRHILCGPQSIAQWTKHSVKRYHQSLPYAHMLWETHVWMKVVMNCLIPGLHYNDITRDRVCLVYALMTGIPEEHLDYMAPLYPVPVDITRTKGSYTEFGPTLTTVERHMRYELIMERMYGLEMLRHQNGYHASTDMQLGEVVRRYPLNDHAKALLGIGPEFRKPIENYIPTDEAHARTSLDVDSDSEEDIYPAKAGDEADRDDAMKG
uniref:Putative plant transposon protein domain-containing protein n=1 Tax=Solanum tuberosum TaxID=4113 RepID=M1DFU7_SOLTU